MSSLNWKELLKRNQKSTAKRKIDTKKSYSSYWMDDDKYARFSGLSGGSSSSNIVKLVKLNNYRRAITNFVKILTNQEIPVKWAGDTSYTDGKSITISTDIKDNNFDVMVGLALHEASHVKLTDFTILPMLFDNIPASAEILEMRKKLAMYPPSIGMSSMERLGFLKNILNWVEDRRIDNYVFSTSPGYKAYYHKLYDTYFNNDKAVIKALGSKSLTDPTKPDHWLFHIINSMNPASDPNALPGLSRVLEIANIRNIKRLTSTMDSLEVSLEMVLEVFKQMLQAAQNPQPQPTNKSQSQSGNSPSDEEKEDQQPQSGGGSSDQEKEASDKEEQEQQGGAAGDEEQEGDNGSGAGDDEEDEGDAEGELEGEEQPELTDAEIRAAMKALEAQKSFGNGNTDKKKANKQLQQQLEKAEKENIEVQATDTVCGKNWSVLTFDYTGKGFTQQLYAAFEGVNNSPDWPSKRVAQIAVDAISYNKQIFNGGTDNYAKDIEKGLEMGGLLGKKLLIRNESRERIDTRLTKGRIDARRLAHAGYGIENIFNQITVDQYKKANLHVSLDLSGSMSGTNWRNTVMMTAAIAKAITYTQNIEMQITVRTTSGENPLLAYIYDSRVNNLASLICALKMISPTGMTPEGLCFEAMIKQHKMIKGTNTLDSYFLNISDGEPCLSSYSGHGATTHTAKQIKTMQQQLDIKVLSFFINAHSTDLESSRSGRDFKIMYGAGAALVDPNSAIEIAKEFNKKFLSK